MKKLYVCQVLDKVSESIISTFTVPTSVCFDRQMETFFKDCEKKGIPVEDFEGFIVACVDVCETYSEAQERLGTGELASFSGRFYLDLKESDLLETKDEVPSNV